MNHQERARLRRERLAGRDLLTGEELYEKSSRICAKLFRLEQVQNSSTLFVYMHYRSEVRTEEFINLCLLLGKTVAVPLTLPAEKKILAVRITDPERDVVPGYRGIPEPGAALRRIAPVRPRDIDTAVIPGSVFDRAGGRLGYGGGFYDRYLARGEMRAFRIGLAYEMQMAERVPAEEHDRFMDMVITENNVYDCRRYRHAQDSRLP
jgi:5-formyltetrahydrofolate cyclo-ligase